MLKNLNVLKFRTLLSFYSQKMLIIRAGTHKTHVRIANREDPDQTADEEAVIQSDLGLHCLSRPFWQATSTQNFKCFKILNTSFSLSVLKNCWSVGMVFTKHPSE